MEPQLDKWAKVHSDAMVIEDYLDWYDRQSKAVLNLSRQQRIYRYFEIDSAKLEQERLQLLKQFRAETKLREE